MPTGPVHNAEVLCRFVYDGGQLRSSGTVKPQGFYPQRDTGRCSVVVGTTMNLNEVREYAAVHVTPNRGKPLKAHAHLRCAVAANEGLQVTYAEPPPNHANIHGYAAAREKMME